MKLHSMSITLILFSLGSICLAQDVETTGPVDPVAVESSDIESPQPAESREKRDERREKRKNRDTETDVTPDVAPDSTPSPQPDQQPGEGETIIDPDFGELVVEPIEGRAEREKRRQEREEKKREQEEYDRLHPKPQRQGLLAIIWGWTLGPILTAIFWPFSLIFTLIKWGGIAMLLFVVFIMFCLGVVMGYYGWIAACWMWRWTMARLAKRAVRQAEP